MPKKPSPQTILSTHSLTDLLELIKEKSKMDYQESVTNLQNQIQNMVSNLGSTKPSKPSTPKPKDKPSKKTTSKKRARNKQPVGDMILSVLSSKPMSIDDILKTITANGFKTSSKNPKQIISLQLMKLSNEKKVQKADRGMYVLVGSGSVGKNVSSSKGTVKKSVKKKTAAKRNAKTASAKKKSMAKAASSRTKTSEKSPSKSQSTKKKATVKAKKTKTKK